MPPEKSPLWYALQSRKFWAAIVGLVLMIIAAVMNRQTIDPNTLVNGIMVVISAYMGAVAIEDGMGKQAEANSTKTTVSTPGGSDVTVTAPSDSSEPQPFRPPHPQ